MLKTLYSLIIFRVLYTFFTLFYALIFINKYDNYFLHFDFDSTLFKIVQKNILTKIKMSFIDIYNITKIKPIIITITNTCNTNFHIYLIQSLNGISNKPSPAINITLVGRSISDKP